MLKIYFIGIVILFSAILLNGLVYKLGITGWYDALQLLSETGSETFSTLRWIDYLWLIVVYPFLLGCSGKLGDYVFNFLKISDS